MAALNGSLLTGLKSFNTLQASGTNGAKRPGRPRKAAKAKAPSADVSTPTVAKDLPADGNSLPADEDMGKTELELVEAKSSS